MLWFSRANFGQHPLSLRFHREPGSKTWPRPEAKVRTLWNGEVAEWSNALSWKGRGPENGLLGSNPSLTAIKDFVGV